MRISLAEIKNVSENSQTIIYTAAVISGLK